jgi:hypothetical protein
MHALCQIYRLYLTHPLSDIETKGTGGLLMKVGSKRRRTKAEINDDKEQELMK